MTFSKIDPKIGNKLILLFFKYQMNEIIECEWTICKNKKYNDSLLNDKYVTKTFLTV